MLSRYQENILKYTNICNSIKDIANITKESELKIQSAILTLARKGNLNKDKAKALLKGTKMINWVDMPITSGLSKPLPNTSERIKTIFCK